MSSAALVRGGWGGLLAAALFVTATTIDLVAPVRSPYVSATDHVHQAVLVLAFLGAAGAVLGLAVLLRRRGRLPRWATLGAVLAAAGHLGVSLLSLNNLLQGERSLVTIRQGAALVLLIGSALLGVLVLITRALPWWCGVLLIVAFPLGDVVDALVRGGEGILLALLWGTVGVALLNRAAAGQEPGRPVRPPRSTVPGTP